MPGTSKMGGGLKSNRKPMKAHKKKKAVKKPMDGHAKKAMMYGKKAMQYASKAKKKK